MLLAFGNEPLADMGRRAEMRHINGTTMAQNTD
jgi:hypothetical protein